MAIFGRHPWSALRQPSFIASDHRTSPVLGLHISGNRVYQALLSGLGLYYQQNSLTRRTYASSLYQRNTIEFTHASAEAGGSASLLVHLMDSDPGHTALSARTLGGKPYADFGARAYSRLYSRDKSAFSANGIFDRLH